MRMLNTTHPGVFVKTEIIESLCLTVAAAAPIVGVSPPAVISQQRVQPVVRQTSRCGNCIRPLTI